MSKLAIAVITVHDI